MIEQPLPGSPVSVSTRVLAEADETLSPDNLVQTLEEVAALLLESHQQTNSQRCLLRAELRVRWLLLHSPDYAREHPSSWMSCLERQQYLRRLLRDRSRE